MVMEYKPYKAQLFVGDTLAAIFARVRTLGRDEAAMLGIVFDFLPENKVMSNKEQCLPQPPQHAACGVLPQEHFFQGADQAFYEDYRAVAGW